MIGPGPGVGSGAAPGAAGYVGRLADVPDGGVVEVPLGGGYVLVGRSGGEVFAVAAECTHDGAPMAQGMLETGPGDAVNLVCPWHFARFCLRTGAALEAPAEEPLTVHHVEVHGDHFTVREGHER